jgi:gamma-glutamyl-gamma-aminobutyrate hydrolase PuuD
MTVIGIVGKPIGEEKSLWSKLKITDDFRKIIIENGAVAIGVLPTNSNYDNVMTKQEKENFDEVLNLCDGIILQGGWKTGNHEIYVAKYAIENNIPILGTCCGLNNMLFSQGDTVQEKRDESHNIYEKDYRHDIIVKERSRLYTLLGENKKVKVNSIHSVMIKDSDVNHFEVVAHDDNGFVEAVELKDKNFCLGVKWHPEIMENDEIMCNIFKEFVKACDEYHRKNK